MKKIFVFLIFFLCFIAVIIGIMISYNLLNGRNPITGGFQKPKPLETLKIPLPLNESGSISTDSDIFKNMSEHTLRESVNIVAKQSAGGGGLGGDYAEFSENCAEQGGEVLIDANSTTAIFECYRRSDDAGKTCRTDADCGSYNCNLQAAVDSRTCILVKTDKDLYNRTYTYTYNCSTSEPGICGEIPRNMPNYYWVGDSVIEYGEKVFPIAEREFLPK